MVLQPGGEVHFGLLDGEAIATFALTPRAEGTLELNKMAVKESHRSRGYGHQMMEYLIGLCRQRGVHTLGTVLAHLPGQRHPPLPQIRIRGHPPPRRLRLRPRRHPDEIGPLIIGLILSCRNFCHTLDVHPSLYTALASAR